jgi:hypothetical protein
VYKGYYVSIRTCFGYETRLANHSSSRATVQAATTRATTGSEVV